MRRSIAIVLLALLGCQHDGGADVPAQPASAASSAGAAAVQAPEQPGPDPRRSPEPPTPEPPSEDPCDPLPQSGQRCSPAQEGSFCVIDWGEPCGASTAAWCRDGAWTYEEEANLCD